MAAALMLGLASEGCGNGGGQTAVKIIVDGQKLTPADKARVYSVWLFVTGDGDGGEIPQMYSTPGGLPGGTYTAVYNPHAKTGTILDIRVTINDMAGAVIDMAQVTVMVRSGNEVSAMVTFGASVDAGDDVGSSPPMGNAGNGGNVGGAGGERAGAGGGSGAGGAGGGSPPDGGEIDAPGSDLPGACATMACSGATADACCPAACTALTDVDCAGCGNGKVDPGEACDPLATCPTACPQMGCQLFTLMGAGTCQATCMAAGKQTMCVNGDGCCPAGCTTVNDTDCSASCGNGAVEGQELCDGNCPAKCLPKGCQLQTLQGSAATCDATCVNGGMQTACANNDGCCPAGCVAANDSDCALVCGNGKIDPGETCDGNCPNSCPPVGCTLRQLAGSAATCDASCVNLANPQTLCLNGDGCCPAACNATNDNDCAAKCGNSVVEKGETCDPPNACTAAATACVNDANTVVTMSGSTAQCTFVCNRTQRTCGPADTYCPTNVTCGPTTDNDCAGCGNSRIEAALGETCDPPLMCMTQMTACVSDNNNVRVSSGSVAACTYKCTSTQRACGAADGFCPTNITCGPTMDSDCTGCGNGKIETALGENCDVAPASPTCAAFSCADTDPCTTDVKTTDGNGCHVTCSHPPVTTCSLAQTDMCCPKGCTSVTDGDCAPTNDKCANALDITSGGDFDFNLGRATAELAAPANCAGGAAAEIFFTFKLADPSAVYLDIYEGGAAVNASIELYDAAPSSICTGPKIRACDNQLGQKECGTAGSPWPRLFVQGLPMGSYLVVVRAQGTPNGNHKLRFQRVPSDCIASGDITQATTGNTCSDFSRVAPTCAASGMDRSYYAEKCPNVGLTVSTCGAGRVTTTIDTVLQMNSGSIDLQTDPLNAMKTCVVAPSGKAVDCNNDDSNCPLTPAGAPSKASTIAGDKVRGERGIITVTVDTGPAGQCGNYVVSSSFVP